GVWDFGGTSAGNASTWQLQFDESGGNVSWVWGTMSPLGGISNTGFLVGYSPGGASIDPGTRDLSATMPFSTGSGDRIPLDLSRTGRPILGGPFTLQIGNMPAGTPLAVFVLGFNQNNPGIDLTPLGMAGCSQYVSLDVSLIALPTGASVPFTLNIPSS